MSPASGSKLIAALKSSGVDAGAVVAILPNLVRAPGMIVTDEVVNSLPSGWKLVLGAFGEMRKDLTYTLLSPYVERKRSIVDALPFQATIIVSFSNVRADVAMFITKNGVDVARKLEDLSDSDFDHWVSSQAIPGNRDDAAEIKAAMQAALPTRFSRVISQLEAFVSNYAGIFIGSTDTRTRKLLLDQEEWDGQMTGLEGLGLDERLRVWNDTVTKIDAQMTDVWSRLRDQLAGLPVDLQYALQQRFKSVWDPIVASVRDADAGVQADIQQVTQAAGVDQRRRDLDRSAIAAKLTQ